MNWIIAGCHCCGGDYLNFHIMGGGTSSEIADNDRFEENGASWSSMTNLPSPARRLHGTVNLLGTAYNFCGQGSGAFRADNDSYIVDTWTAKTDVPTGRNDVSCGVVADRGYCIKGQSGSFTWTDVNEEYEPSGDSWSTVTSMPSPARRGEASQFSVDDGVFVCVGHDGVSGPISDNDKYSPSGGSWTAKTNATTPTSSAGSMGIGSCGYLIGGEAGGTKNEEYDPLVDSWSSKTAIGYSSGGCRAVGGATHGFACGGVQLFGSTLRSNNERYDQDSDAWSASSAIPSPARYQCNAGEMA